MPASSPARFATLLLLTLARPLVAQAPADPADRIEIVRTAYGVPHIRAADLEAAGFGLGWVQMEDHGARVVRGLLGARGEMGRHFGRDSVDGDFRARLDHGRAVTGFPMLDRSTRDVYSGFASAVNRYVASHPGEFGPDVVPGGVPRFQGHDVLARDVVGTGSAGAFVRRLEERGADSVVVDATGSSYRPDPGSNAWALGPSRTTSGNAILLRNPHLSWTAGYYEGHVTVPGVLDFYGDFRVGGPFGIIGGFNPRLGWATTNNYPDGDEVYALREDPGAADRVRLDGRAVPVLADTVGVEVRRPDGALETLTRVFERTSLGPVVARRDGWVFVVKSAMAGEIRLGQQFLRMMTARDLGEWTDAMRIHARVASNFTYADTDGNILVVWNAGTPELPHAPTGDTLATVVEHTSDAWSRLVPWDDLPRVVNPPGGYVHNENDPFHYANLHVVADPADFPANFPAPGLRLRSQLSLDLIGGEDRLSLEEVVARKGSYRMLLADRVKDDLVAALADTRGEDALARDLLAAWDDRAAPESRGAVLFVEWWDRYLDAVEEAQEDHRSREGRPPETGATGDAGGGPWAEPWDPARPTETPRGLARPDLAARVFPRAVESVRSRFGAVDVPWGDVHRARVGDVDVPVGGCSGDYGCFRVLWFTDDDDGLRRVRGGDGWVLAVEFGARPRAYSVLAYGMTADPTDPHCCDQVAMFARGEMKPVLFEWDAIEAGAVRRYRPGGSR